MLQGWLAHGSLALLLVALLAAGFGVPLPEDPILLTAGALAHRSSSLSAPATLVSVYVATIASDCGLYFLARWFGEGLLSKPPMKWLATPQRRARVRDLLARYGAQAIFWGRHVAGVRSLLFVAAGLEGVPFRKFLAFDALAGMVTIPLVFGLGYFFSNHLALVEAGIARAEHWFLAAVGVLILGGILVWSLCGSAFGATLWKRWRASRENQD